MQVVTFGMHEVAEDPSLVEGLVFLSQDSQARVLNYIVPEQEDENKPKKKGK